MARPSTLLAAALALVAMFACGELHAQARGPPVRALRKPALNLNDPAQRAAEVVRLDSWLRRLVGNFRFEGIVQFGVEDERGVKGTRKCTGIDSGPGVQCEINMMWSEIGPDGERGPYSYLKPAMALYGISPTTAEISFLQVDNRGIPEGARARLRDGGVVRFQVPCPNEPPVCRSIVRITAKPDGTPVQMKIELWGNYYTSISPSYTWLLTLYPLPETATEDAAQASPAQRH